MSDRLITGKGDAEQTGRLIGILRATPSLMQVLSIARTLDLPEWLLFSGAVYQPVLNHLTGRAPDYGIKDYDLAYFDGSDLSYGGEDMVIRRVASAFDVPLRHDEDVRRRLRVYVVEGDHPIIVPRDLGPPLERNCLVAVDRAGELPTPRPWCRRRRRG